MGWEGQLRKGVDGVVGFDGGGTGVGTHGIVEVRTHDTTQQRRDGVTQELGPGDLHEVQAARWKTKQPPDFRGGEPTRGGVLRVWRRDVSSNQLPMEAAGLQQWWGEMVSGPIGSEYGAKRPACLDEPLLRCPGVPDAIIGLQFDMFLHIALTVRAIFIYTYVQ